MRTVSALRKESIEKTQLKLVSGRIFLRSRQLWREPAVSPEPRPPLRLNRVGPGFRLNAFASNSLSQTLRRQRLPVGKSAGHEACMKSRLRKRVNRFTEAPKARSGTEARDVSSSLSEGHLSAALHPRHWKGAES